MGFYCNGATEQALGARIRMAFATVGAMRSTVAGVFMCSAFIPVPYRMMGKGTKAAREK